MQRADAEMAAKEKSKAKSGMSGKERRTKCSAEWKEMKAAGKTSALKWPKFYSDCNKRLKGAERRRFFARSSKKQIPRLRARDRHRR